MNYLRMDYVRLRIIRALASVTVAFMLGVGLLGLYEADFIFENVMSLPIRSFLWQGGVVFLVLCAIFVGVTWYTAAKEYDESHARAGEYYTTLQELIELYKEEEQGQEDSES